METVSENSKGRGRPRKYERDRYGYYLTEFDRYEADMTRGISEKYIGSVRQQQNVVLAERAKDFFSEAYFEVSPEDEDTDWYRFLLMMEMPEAFADNPHIPQRVMTELGRLLSDGRTEDAWSGAEWFYRYRATKAHIAQKIIRDFRLGRRDTLPGASS